MGLVSRRKLPDFSADCYEDGAVPVFMFHVEGAELVSVEVNIPFSDRALFRSNSGTDRWTFIPNGDGSIDNSDAWACQRLDGNSSKVATEQEVLDWIRLFVGSGDMEMGDFDGRLAHIIKVATGFDERRRRFDELALIGTVSAAAGFLTGSRLDLPGPGTGHIPWCYEGPEADPRQPEGALPTDQAIPMQEPEGDIVPPTQRSKEASHCEILAKYGLKDFYPILVAAGNRAFSLSTVQWAFAAPYLGELFGLVQSVFSDYYENERDPSDWRESMEPDVNKLLGVEQRRYANLDLPTSKSGGPYPDDLIEFHSYPNEVSTQVDIGEYVRYMATALHICFNYVDHVLPFLDGADLYGETIIIGDGGEMNLRLPFHYGDIAQFPDIVEWARSAQGLEAPDRGEEIDHENEAKRIVDRLYRESIELGVIAQEEGFDIGPNLKLLELYKGFKFFRYDEYEANLGRVEPLRTIVMNFVCTSVLRRIFNGVGLLYGEDGERQILHSSSLGRRFLDLAHVRYSLFRSDLHNMPGMDRVLLIPQLRTPQPQPGSV